MHSGLKRSKRLKLARKNYRLWVQEPRHPSLHFKQIGNYCSVRVTFPGLGRGFVVSDLGLEVVDVELENVPVLNGVANGVFV